MPTIQEIIGGKQIANQYTKKKPKTVMEQVVATPPAVPVQSMAKPVAQTTQPIVADPASPPIPRDHEIPSDPPPNSGPGGPVFNYEKGTMFDPPGTEPPPNSGPGGPVFNYEKGTMFDPPGTEPPPPAEEVPITLPSGEPPVAETLAQDALGDLGGPPEGGNAQAVLEDQKTMDEWLKENPDPTQYPGGLPAWQAERNRRRDRDRQAQENIEGPQPEAKEMTKAEFLAANPDPTQYPGGLPAWQAERNRLAELERNTPQTEITDNQRIEQDKKVNSFLDDILANAGELSPEEEATLRREVQTGVQKALSGLSSRGLGRGSESLGVITQGAIAEETAVGAAKRDVREKGRELQMRAAQMMESRTEADRNYQLAISGQNLDALKNKQNQTLQERAQQLDWARFEESKAQLEREFGLALDEAELRKYVATGELTMKAIDLDQTNTARMLQISNEHLARMTEAEIEQRLGMSRLEAQKWIAGEGFEIQKVGMAMERVFKELDIQVSREQIEAGLKELEEAGKTDYVDKYMDYVKMNATLLSLFL